MMKAEFLNLFLDDKKVVEEVKKIFGLEFKELEKFFFNTFFSFEKNRASVFFTRRCLLLAKFFLQYLLENNKDENIEIDDSETFPIIRKNGLYNYLLSDKADFHDLPENVSEIYLVDDICIHGNTLYEMAENLHLHLLKMNLKPTVVTSVYMISEESIRRVPDKYYKSVRRAGWTDLSQKIVNAINIANIPYVSYLHTWTKNVKKDEFEKILGIISSNKKLEMIEYELDQYDHKKCYYIYEKTYGQLNSEDISCFRMYYNDLTKTLAFVPFVIILSSFLQGSDVNGLSIEKELMAEILKNEKKQKIFNENDYRYNLLSCLRSYLYGIYFIEKYLNIKREELLREYIQDISGCLRFTYGKDILTLLNKNCKNYKINQASDEILKANTTDENMVRAFVEKICREKWLDQEYSGFRNISKSETSVRRHVYVKDIIQDSVSEMNDRSKEELYFYKHGICFNLIRLCDMGRMSIASCENKGGSMLKAGELGYTLTKELLQESKEEIISTQNNEWIEMMKDPYYRCLFL